MSEFERSALLLSQNGIDKLSAAHVAVFGVGGVGSYAVEALARAGIGHFTLIDPDTVSESNCNRQLVAMHSTLAQYKVDVAKAHILDINPRATVDAKKLFYTVENAPELSLDGFDYIVDAIDTISAKIELIVRAKAAQVPIICAMGCGNKLDPTRFVVTDLYKTSFDPVAKILRHELRRRDVNALKVVYSTEPARVPLTQENDVSSHGKRQTPGSVSFVPGVAGLILAGVVVRAISGNLLENE
ncbi:MAG: tRNA threonylcarbamoyladenosine dehydratase [Ruthenibacterium sp.]